MARLITRRWLLGRTLLVALTLAAAGAGQADAAGRPKGASAAAPAAIAPAAAATEPARPGLLVFAAASLADALEEVDRAFTAATGVRVAASYAASSVLAKQIEAGAPADAFFSADLAWVDYLEKRGLIKPGSRRDVLTNTLVLIAPADSPLRLRIAPGLDLAGALEGGRLAIADPDSVPAGEYARAALTRLGVWSRVSDRVVRGENVRAALAYVARGEAPLGIVYGTDAQAERRVRVVAVFPEDSHPPITYPVALTARARPEAAQLVEFLMGDAARQIFVRYGFTAPSQPQLRNFRKAREAADRGDRVIVKGENREYVFERRLAPTEHPFVGLEGVFGAVRLPRDKASLREKNRRQHLPSFGIAVVLPTAKSNRLGGPVAPAAIESNRL
jgi:molybdate transport system substrate-binding protein